MSQAMPASSQDLIARAEAILGYSFKDRAVLGLALTHASSADHRLASNERLEFLGDAVLGLIVCEYLFAHYPDLQEGDLTKIKSAVVSRETCARVADELGLTDLIVLGKGMSNRGAIPRSLCAGVYEAVIGALFLDSGLEFTRMFILDGVKTIIRSAVRSGHQQNFKSVLQQLVQQATGISPQYLLLDEKGPDHAKCFEICVEVGAQRFPSSWGRSKKAAEQQAALNALIGLGYAMVDADDEVRLCVAVESDEAVHNGHAVEG